MSEVFQTVFILSLFGFGITALLLLIKPITVKKFPAKWQYYIWIAVMLSMVIPIHKFIPEQEVQRIVSVTQTENLQQISVEQAAPSDGDMTETAMPPISNSPAPSLRENLQEHSAERGDILALIWIAGVCLYLIIIAVSYTAHLIRRRKNSFLIENNPIFENVKKELGINRKIKLKTAKDIVSPMLSGVFFPTVYLPAKNISDENMRMVFLHELTHYKRKDLIIKWLALFVNALHWFNPLAYILCSNISQACEASCDMAVTHNMSESQQKTYMKTILDLAE